MQATVSIQGQIVGREGELAELYELLGVESSAHALVVTGEPGIGKTTLWDAGLDRAREEGLLILSARASGAETRLSFAALSDLLHGLDMEEIPDLPAPQRHALEVALLRAEPAGEPPEPRAIGSGLLNALRALAGRQPLLVAIDDVQWLDPPSADALGFAARRLRDDPVRFLLTKRTGTASALERSLERDGLKQLRVDGLSAGAVRRLLFERLGLTLPRRVLRGLSEAAQGNPLFALELGRTIAERGLPEIGDQLEVPEGCGGPLRPPHRGSAGPAAQAPALGRPERGCPDAAADGDRRRRPRRRGRRRGSSGRRP